MLIRMVDENKVSTDKKPSPELFSLIKAAANDLLSFGELWQSIKKKGNDEGFSEKELQDMLRPFLKEKLDSKKVWYLFHKDEQIERVQNRTKFSTNAAKKETEQTSIPAMAALIPEPSQNIKDAGVFEVTTAEDPKDLEIQFLKEKVIELEEALKKTQLFVPATQLPTINEAEAAVAMTDEAVYKYLRDRATQTGDVIVIDRVGSGALAQALHQYKGSFGVAELFLRVIK